MKPGKRSLESYEGGGGQSTNGYGLSHNSTKYQPPAKKSCHSDAQSAIESSYTNSQRQPSTNLPLNIQNNLLTWQNIALYKELVNQQNIVNQYSVHLAAQNQRMQDLEAKLAKKESKSKKKKQKIENLTRENEQQKALINEYIDIKGDLIQKLSVYEQQEPPITKLNVLKKLEKTLLTKVSRSILIDFVINESGEQNELNQVGRVEVDGRKQHRHIIPHALLSKAIKNAVGSPKKANELLTNLSEIITAIYSFEKNICLKEQNYKNLEISKDIYFDRIITTKDTYYFIDTEQHRILFDESDDITQNDAKDLYREKYRKFIVHDLEKLMLSAGDDANTITMISELLIKFIYTIFNQNSVVSYPDAGNSRNYEIRLYNSFSDAKNPKDKKYEILTHSEINKYFIEDKKNEISGKIRIVNNEGSNVKKSIEAFELFGQIIDCDRNLKNNSESITKYNKSHNKILKLENLSVDLTKYNQDLTKDNLETQLVLHVVKHLFFLLDLKPLEQLVFVPSNNQQGIKVFNNATTKSFSYYNVVNGQELRDNERKLYKDKIACRTEIIDKEILAAKINNEIDLLKFSQPSFTDAFNNVDFCNNLLEESFNLYSSAYNIDFKKDDYINESQSKVTGEDSTIMSFTEAVFC